MKLNERQEKTRKEAAHRVVRLMQEISYSDLQLLIGSLVTPADTHSSTFPWLSETRRKGTREKSPPSNSFPEHSNDFKTSVI